MKHGMYHSQAIHYAQVKRHWPLSDTGYMNATFDTKFWNSKGYTSLLSVLEKHRQVLQTAVYGSVRTVV